MTQKLMPRLDFPSGHCGGPIRPITEHDSVAFARRLLEDPRIPARERVAGILVGVYAQPIVRVARFTIDQITLTDSETTIRFAETAVILPDPVASAMRAWLEQRQAAMPPLASVSR
jgi:hypothetical protein